MKNKKNTRFIAVGIGIAVMIGIGVAVALAIQGSNGKSSESFDNPRVVSWRHVHGLGVDPSDSNILYIATHGDFYKSLNGEVPIKVDLDRADYMAFNSPQAEGAPLYASGHPATGGNMGLVKSTDGGQTWHIVSTVLKGQPVDFHAMAVSRIDPSIIIGFDSAGRGLFKTIDAGRTWESFDYPAQYVISLAISPTSSDVIFAGTDNGLYQSNDGAATWTQLKEYKGVGVMALAFDADGNLYSSTEEFGLAKSSDLGKTWQAISKPPNNLTTTSIAVDSENNAIYVAGHAAPQGYQEVFKGVLGGSSWQLIGTNKQ